LLAMAALAVQTASASARSLAGSDVSSNWAGYVTNGLDAMSGAPTRFTSVSGGWVQPRARCSAGGYSAQTSSAFWVGLGGNAQASRSLEQVGTEVDCTPEGARYWAWYELVPAAAVRLKLVVSPGDSLSAAVSVAGTKVSVRMRNLTRGTAFSKTLRMAAPDTSSAEWIAEAPSVCANSEECQQLALTNFGTVAFSGARTSSNGHGGSISDPAWQSSQVSLEARGGGFGSGRFGRQVAAAQAVPSALGNGGASFSIRWSTEQAPAAGGYGDGYGSGRYGYASARRL